MVKRGGSEKAAGIDPLKEFSELARGAAGVHLVVGHRLLQMFCVPVYLGQ